MFVIENIIGCSEPQVFYIFVQLVSKHPYTCVRGQMCMHSSYTSAEHYCVWPLKLNSTSLQHSERETFPAAVGYVVKSEIADQPGHNKPAR